jgi:hypothetical protein
MKDGGGDQFRAALAKVREYLISPDLQNAPRMAIELQRAVDHMQNGPPLTKSDLLEVRGCLAELRTLFERAYALHAGWFELVNGGGFYSSKGKLK